MRHEKEALKKRKSLLSCGIIGAEGDFGAGSVVSVCGEDGAEFAVGITYYSQKDTVKRDTGDKNDIVIHANNIAIR